MIAANQMETRNQIEKIQLDMSELKLSLNKIVIKGDRVIENKS